MNTFQKSIFLKTLKIILGIALLDIQISFADIISGGSQQERHTEMTPAQATHDQILQQESFLKTREALLASRGQYGLIDYGVVFTKLDKDAKDAKDLYDAKVKEKGKDYDTADTEKGNASTDFAGSYSAVADIITAYNAANNTTITQDNIDEADIAKIIKAKESEISIKQADFNDNGEVNYGDYTALALHFGKNTKSPNWESEHAKFDLSKNGSIDFGDFLLLAANYDKKCPKSTQTMEQEKTNLETLKSGLVKKKLAEEVYNALKPLYDDWMRKEKALANLQQESIQLTATTAYTINGEVVSIGDSLSINEKFTFGAVIVAKSANGNYYQIEAVELPEGARFNADVNVYYFSWQPNYNQGRQEPYTAKFKVKGINIIKEVKINVGDVKQPISLKQDIPLDARTVKEGGNLELALSPYLDTNLEYGSYLEFSLLESDQAKGFQISRDDGVLTYSPGYNAVTGNATERIENVTIQVLSSRPWYNFSLPINVTILNTNRAPVISDNIQGLPELIDGKYIFKEGETYTFTINATDEDIGDQPSLTYTALGNYDLGDTFDLGSENLFIPVSGNSGTFTWAVSSSKTVKFTFRVSDGKQIVERVIDNVVVIGRPVPSITTTSSSDNITIEGETNINFTLDAKDQYNGSYAITSSSIPDGATLVKNTTGAYIFNWTPAYAQAHRDPNNPIYPEIRQYSITFKTTDIKGNEITKTITINVNDSRIAAIDDFGKRVSISSNVNGTTLDHNYTGDTPYTFTITATDPENKTIYYAARLIKIDASGNPIGSREGEIIKPSSTSNTFTWIPGSSLAGRYLLQFEATDSEGYAHVRKDYIGYYIEVKSLAQTANPPSETPNAPPTNEAPVTTDQPPAPLTFKYKNKDISQIEYNALKEIAKIVAKKATVEDVTQADINALKATVIDGKVMAIELSDRAITSIPEKIRAFGNLSYLDLSDNPNIEISIGILKSLPGLENLYLNGSGVDDTDIQNLSSLTGLKYLRLHANPDIKNISSLTNLTTLCGLTLDGTGINLADPATISVLRKLRTIIDPDKDTSEVRRYIYVDNTNVFNTAAPAASNTATIQPHTIKNNSFKVNILYPYIFSPQINMTWEIEHGPDNNNPITGFKIYRKLDKSGQDFELISHAGGNVRGFTDNDITANEGDSYVYTVEVLQDTGENGSPLPFATTAPIVIPYIGIPYYIRTIEGRATSPSSIYLSWSSPTGNTSKNNKVLGFDLFRNGNKINPSLIAPETTSFIDIDHTLIPGQNYNYEIRVIQGDGNAFTARETIGGVYLPKPGILHRIQNIEYKITSSAVELGWADNIIKGTSEFSITGYRISRKLKGASDADYEVLYQPPAGHDTDSNIARAERAKVSFGDTIYSLEGSSTYTYKVEVLQYAQTPGEIPFATIDVKIPTFVVQQIASSAERQALIDIARATNSYVNALKITAIDGKVTELDLSYLNLTNIPQGLNGLTNLTKLYLNNNHITVIPKDTFKDLTNLTKLWLNENPINLRDSTTMAVLNAVESRGVTLYYSR